MKWFSVALFASAVSAVPTPQTTIPRIVYNLKVSARDISLDGKYLSVRDNTVGIYSDSSKTKLSFYPVENRQNQGLAELHTVKGPSSPSDNAVLSLVGSQGLLAFTQVVNPGAITFPEGTDADWTSFSLVDDTSGGRVGKRLMYAASRTGKWVAFPLQNGEWKITWLEGTAWVPQNYIPVDVIYEQASRIIIG